MSDMTLDAVTERSIAVELFNQVWQLLERDDRSSDEDAEMVHMAHASLLHWLHVGGEVEAARGEWQCSRVYAVVERGEPALWHARRVLEICERARIADFDLAFAYEALARAHAVRGEADRARDFAERTLKAADDVADADDRELVLSDLATIPL